MDGNPKTCARFWRSASIVCLVALVGAWLLPTQAFAQSGGDAIATAAAEAPLPVMTRDANGKVTIRATRISQPLKVDGHLDESVYGEVQPITEFIQQEPNVGQPITEKTEAWVLFDDNYLYVVCRCWDQHPERIVANDMRRDSSNLSQHDNFAAEFDTFHDGRTGLLMYVTAIGAMRDAAVTDFRPNSDWNPIWDGKVSRFANGWISEMAYPFKSLRYGPGRQQTWGVHLRRTIRSKNEVGFLTLVNPQWGVSAVHHMEAAATLVGLEVPPPARNLEIKPYAISRLTTDLVRQPQIRNDVEPDAGIDVKYGVTQGLTADLTYNTDFAQVEADEAQVNLTRFSLSFPEKREFFIEGQGIFAFGAGGAGSGAGGGEGGGGGNEAPTIFYSRRIGLNGSRVIPVIAGGRLSGKAGAWSLGALNITTDDDAFSKTPQTNFSVVRLRRDILKQSTIGGIFSRRSVSTVAPGANNLWGLDAAFLFYENVNVGAYVAQSLTEGMKGDDLSYRGQFNYTADRYGLSVDRIVVEKHFNPEVGFLRRQDFRRNFAQARFSPRTKKSRLIRRYNYQTSLEYTTDNKNHLESREAQGSFRIDFHNADAFSVQHSRSFEFLPAPFQISRGVRLPVGGYGFYNTRVAFNAGVNHRVTGSASYETGTFYSGNKNTAEFRGRVELTPRFGVEPNISFNWVDLPEGQFTDKVIGGRTFFTMSPRSFVAALIQYSSANTSLSTNLRLRWEYRPGSEMFIVYTEGRSTLPEHGVPLENRGLVVKINRLFRF